MSEHTTCPHPSGLSGRCYDWPIGGRILHMRHCVACGSDVSTGQTFVFVAVTYADGSQKTEALDAILDRFTVSEDELKSLRAGDRVALGHGVHVELAEVES